MTLCWSGGFLSGTCDFEFTGWLVGNWRFISGCCIVATTQEQMELLPCAALSTWTWWTYLPPLFNNWDDAGQPPSPTRSHLGHLFAGIAMSSWRNTKRHDDFLFWKRSVSPSFLAVFFVVLLWVVFVFGFVLFGLWKPPGCLLFTCSRTTWENSWSKTKRFDERESLERARHELKKKVGLVVLLPLLPPPYSSAFNGWHGWWCLAEWISNSWLRASIDGRWIWMANNS